MSQVKRYCGNCQRMTWHEKYKHSSLTDSRQSMMGRIGEGLMTSGLSEFMNDTIVECCDCGRESKI